MDFSYDEKKLILRAARIIIDMEHQRKIELEKLQRRQTIQYLIENVVAPTKE